MKYIYAHEKTGFLGHVQGSPENRKFAIKFFITHTYTHIYIYIDTLRLMKK